MEEIKKAVMGKKGLHMEYSQDIYQNKWKIYLFLFTFWKVKKHEKWRKVKDE